MERENLINSINQKIEELDLHLIREKVSDGDRVTINNRSIAIKELLDDLERAIDAFNKAKEEGLLEDVSLMGLSLILNTLSNLENEFKRIQNGQLSNLNNLGSQIAQLSNHLRIYVPKPLTTAEVKGLVDSYKLLKKSLKELEKERKKADEDLHILRNGYVKLYPSFPCPLAMLLPEPFPSVGNLYARGVKDYYEVIRQVFRRWEVPQVRVHGFEPVVECSEIWDFQARVLK